MCNLLLSQLKNLLVLKLHVVCPGMSAALRTRVLSFLSHHTSKQLKMVPLILWMWLMEMIIISHKKWRHTVISQYFSGKFFLHDFQRDTTVLLNDLRKGDDKLITPYRQSVVVYSPIIEIKYICFYHGKVINEFITEVCTILCTRKYN